MKMLRLLLAIMFCFASFSLSAQAEDYAVKTELTAAQAEEIEAAFNEILLDRDLVNLLRRPSPYTVGFILIVPEPEEVTISRVSRDGTWYCIRWENLPFQTYHFDSEQHTLLVFVDLKVLDRQMTQEEIGRLILCLQNLRRFRDTDPRHPIPDPTPTPVSPKS